MTRRELILYAVPTGPLADQCEGFFDAAREQGPTLAQDYPAHCTLTGFFCRRPARADEVAEEVRSVVSAHPMPPDSAPAVELHAGDRWVGLELRSRWLRELTERVVEGHRLEPGDDPLRPKGWLHLSLAYGVEDLAPYADLARRSFDPSVDGGWRVALWERTSNRSWIEH